MGKAHARPKVNWVGPCDIPCKVVEAVMAVAMAEAVVKAVAGDLYRPASCTF